MRRARKSRRPADDTKGLHRDGRGMNRPHTLILSAGLLLSPALITAEEWVRLTVDNSYVEIESDPVADAASHLQAVADRLAWWHAAAYLDLAFIATWALALLAITVVVARTRPMLAAMSGLLGLVSALGLAMHWAFYYIPLASLAQKADRDLAARAASASGDDRLLVIALLMFLLGTLLAVLGAGVGLWRAHALPWWAALGLVVWLGSVVAGTETRPAALLNLALLLPFLAVARRLAPSKDPVARRKPTPV
jgi:hypothetical protein